MSGVARLTFVFGLMVLPQWAALAGDNYASHCVDASVPRGLIEARSGRWIELTPNQWQFLRGIYAMNPQTPPGLPYGDRAVLAQLAGDEGGMVFFIDGDKACTPMQVPRELVAMMRDIAINTINHEGAGL
jgi:hypothetical protein